MFRAPSCIALALVLASGPAWAQLPQDPASQASPVPGPASDAPAAGPAPGEPGFLSQLFTPDRSAFLGGIYGLRPALSRAGISLGLQETSEVFGNATGGLHQGIAYNGLTFVSLGLDTDRAFGLAGGTFNISAFQIHGRNLSADNLNSLNTSSGIQAQRATRIWELWYQQSIAGGRADLKFGQQSLDQEFITSSGASLFVNTALGWPTLPSYNLYAGGPAYPLSSLGIRLRARINDQVTALFGVFNDNPPGGPFVNDSQVRGASQSGTRFNLGTGALVIGELQYALNPPPPKQDGQPATRTGLPGTYKIGAWYDTARFFDQEFDANRVSLGNQATTGIPRPRRGNWSIYAVADQTVWQPNADEPFAVGVFARAMGAPGDRNLITMNFNAGINAKAPFKGRDNDSIGLAYGYAGVGRGAGIRDRDAFLFAGTPTPGRSGESFLELSYQYQVAPWWLLQPDAQYIFLPGGGIVDPGRPNKRVGNELILGLRTNITF